MLKLKRAVAVFLTIVAASVAGAGSASVAGSGVARSPSIVIAEAPPPAGEDTHWG